MDKFGISIVEYLGRVEDGILVLIGLTYDSKYYEATFFYQEKEILLTISEELETIIGDIKNHPEYQNILKSILNKIVPYREMAERIDPVDFSRWVQGVIEIQGDDVEEVDESEIQKDTE